ncbi:MAG: hypothetical protein HY682_09725 [Chloroflexi bacterium]|nr:hypothetical protein [Chloroflexota bacterium]
MRTVYAVRFEVGSSAGQPPEHAAPTVQRMAADWVTEWYGRSGACAPDVPIDGGDWQASGGHLLRVRRVRAGAGVELWSLTWSHPSDKDETLLWASECLVATADGETEVSVVVRLESTAFRIAPSQFEIGRPRLVRRLVAELPCRQNGRLLRATPQLLSVSDMPAFIERELLSPDRVLPVIVFSRDSWSDAYLADPGATADAVVGLAHVYALKDKWASFALTNELGRSLSCFNGAVRIYWPALARGSDPDRHSLVFPDRVRKIEAEGRLADALFRRLAPISAVRFIQGAVTSKVLVALEEDETRLREQVRNGLMDRAALELQILEAWDARDKLRRELEREQHTTIELELKIAELEDENRDLKANFAEVRRFTSGSGEQTPKPGEEGEVEARSVREALDRAACDFAQSLEVWRSAEESAEKSSFSRPAQVYQALLAINEVADTYFRSRATGKPMGPWEKAFGERGFKYAATESQNTLNMYGEERVFVHKGRKLQMQRHLTLGGGDRRNCLQIYFELDDGSQRFVIGYCGVHLRYYGMTT